MNTETTAEPIGNATYSPEDNKLRLYPFARLPRELYDRVKAHGFTWAPKQELFVAPMWTPDRADLLEELCGEIGDEDKTLAERAEERAERFEDYEGSRRADASQARDAVKAIADHIPFGQPILVGHHSEKRARKDAERIESGMRKAVKMWETADYWKSRAAGAVSHAKYKERPDVRARRIKTIEADRRKSERIKAGYEHGLKFWRGEIKFKSLNTGEVGPLAITEENREKIICACGRDNDFNGFYLPKKEGDRPDFNQSPCPYSALKGDYPSLYAPRTVEECRLAAERSFPAWIANRQRWLDHYDNRLAYERAMLAADGGTVADQIKPEVGGAYSGLWSPRGGWAYIRKVNKVTATVHHQWNAGGRIFTQNIPFDKMHKIMTKAQVDAARAAGRLVEVPEIGFLLSPEPTTPKIDNVCPDGAACPDPVCIAERQKQGLPVEAVAPVNPADEFKAMREQLRQGTAVQVVAAPQLFPTPKELARRVADLADIRLGHRVLEPSAGTGMLVGAMGCRMMGRHLPGCGPEGKTDGEIVAVEINRELAKRLRSEFPLTDVRCADFLELNGELGTFDRILMNPPFKDGADIKHILHARAKLKPGGRLVAICANGPRQQAELEPLADLWEPLPDGTFADQGTNVRTVLLTIQN